MVQGATGEPNFWGKGGRTGQHKEKPIVVQGSTGEQKEKPGFGSEGAGRMGSIRNSQVSSHKSRNRWHKNKSREHMEHKGRDPQRKKITMPTFFASVNFVL